MAEILVTDMSVADFGIDEYAELVDTFDEFSGVRRSFSNMESNFEEDIVLDSMMCALRVDGQFASGGIWYPSHRKAAAYLSKLVTAKQFRSSSLLQRIGYGGHVLGVIEQRVAQEGFNALHLRPMKGSGRFYLKQGYRGTEAEGHMEKPLR